MRSPSNYTPYPWICVGLCAIAICSLGAASADIALDTSETLLSLVTVPLEDGMAPKAHAAEHHGHASFEQAEGWVNQAMRMKESIRAETETKHSICIALLRRVQTGSGRTLELYARQWGCGGLKPSYEFFLFLRPQPHAKATMLGQWKMKVDGPGKFFQRAFLDYDTGSGMALVQVTDGLDGVLVKETVPLTSQVAP
jgi:hypothetical protein